MSIDDTNAGGILAGYTPETQFAIEVGVTPRTLRSWRQRGEGPPYIRVGTSILYPTEGSKEWLKSLEVKPPRQPVQRRR